MFGGDGPDRTGTADRDLAWQELKKIADRLTATADRQALQHFSDENEQGDDQSGEELADGRRCDDGNRHRQLHRHAPLDNIVEGLLQNRPAADQKADDTDDADSRERLPDPEPHGRSRDGHKGNTGGFEPLKRMVVVMPVIVIIVMMVMLVMVVVLPMWDVLRD